MRSSESRCDACFLFAGPFEDRQWAGPCRDGSVCRIREAVARAAVIVPASRVVSCPESCCERRQSYVIRLVVNAIGDAPLIQQKKLWGCLSAPPGPQGFPLLLLSAGHRRMISVRVIGTLRPEQVASQQPRSMLQMLATTTRLRWTNPMPNLTETPLGCGEFHPRLRFEF